MKKVLTAITIAAILIAVLLSGASAQDTSRCYSFIWDSANGMTKIGGGVLNSYHSIANGINNSGQVVGTYYSGIDHPYIWSATAGVNDIARYWGWEYCGNDINNSGVITGNADDSPGNHHNGFTWDTVNHYISLGTGRGNAINDNGVVVGECPPEYFSRPRAAIRYTGSSSWTDIGTLGGDYSYAYGINNNNVVVGYAATATSANAFIWDATNGIRAFLPDGVFGYAVDINDAGQIVGAYARAGQIHAFLWDGASGLIDLNLPGASRAYGINNLGQVVGYYQPTNELTHAFIWDSTNGFNDLGTAFGTDKGYIATDINDLGQVVGYYIPSTPEPSSILALVCGLAGTIGIARRKR